MGSEHPDLDDRELARDVADVERLTGRVLEAAAAGLLAVPAWLVLLLVFPALGLGVGLSLFFASLIACVVAFAAWRWVVPRRGRTRGARALSLSPGLRRTMLVLAALIVLYVVVVVRAGG